jgi:SAM-dependent methyltransferase
LPKLIQSWSEVNAAVGAVQLVKKKTLIKKALMGFFALLFLMLLSPAQIQQKKPEVPYVSTPDDVVMEMLKMADVDKDDVLYDLGCGDGRIVITAVKEMRCRGVGIDLDSIRIKESRENAIEAGVSDRAKFILSNLFEADISQATVVTLYLLSKVNLRLRPKLFRELNPGTRIVSHDFDMGKWSPDESKYMNNDRDDVPIVYDPFTPDSFVLGSNWDRHNVYLWVMPANVTGVWKWTMPMISGNTQYSLEIEQTFQEIKGKAYEGSSSIPVSIKDGKIRGDKLEFNLESQREGRTEQFHFEGFVKGHTMEGFVRVKGKPDFKEKWRAERILSTFKTIGK